MKKIAAVFSLSVSLANISIIICAIRSNALV